MAKHNPPFRISAFGATPTRDYIVVDATEVTVVIIGCVGYGEEPNKL